MRIFGFTGSRRGMTQPQEYNLRQQLQRGDILLHGDCVGADAQAHDIALDSGCLVEIYPPTDVTMRARCVGGIVHPAQDYIARNHAIVDHCGLLIATPLTPEEEQRSGTWATMRYAKRINKRVILLTPDGLVQVWSR